MKIAQITLAHAAAITGAQVALVSSIVLETAGLIAVNPKFEFSHYQASFAQQSHLSASSIGKVLVVVKKFQAKMGPLVAAYQFDESGVLAFAHWIKDSLAPTLYRLTLDDMSNYLDGKPSTKEKEKTASDKKRQVETLALKAARAVVAPEVAEWPNVVAPVVAASVAPVVTESIGEDNHPQPLVEVVAIVAAPLVESVLANDVSDVFRQLSLILSLSEMAELATMLFQASEVTVLQAA